MVRPLITQKFARNRGIVVKSPNKHISTPLGSPRNRTVVIPAPEPVLGFICYKKWVLFITRR
jgi:hypothetical protein